MHHHSTKQRLAALRRRFGIQLTPPKWAKDRSRQFKEAAAAIKSAQQEATRQIVAALTPAPSAELSPSMFAVAGGPSGDDAPTTVAEAPYPSQHLSATDAERSRPGGGGDDSGGGGSKRWVWIVLLVAVAVGLLAWCGLSGKKERAAPTPPPAPVQAVAPAPAPEPPPPPPPPPPAPRKLTVQKGDCLWRLAASHLGDAQAWRKLFEANRERIRNPDLIYPGQTFELP
jgi:nucleoid-associated protein YgaU